MFCIACMQLYNKRSSPGDKCSRLLRIAKAMRKRRIKKRGAEAPREKPMPSSSSPQIIVVIFLLRLLLRAIFLAHTLEDRHIRGRHVDDLEADIKCVGIHTIGTAPFAAGNEY